MENNKKMAFLAHWVETWNWLLWFCPCLHNHPEKRYWLVWLYPIYWTASAAYLLGKKAYDVVDRFNFRTTKTDGGSIACRTVLLRNFAWHFFFPAWRGNIRKRILMAVLDLQDEVDVIGLGALTKDERVTRGGKWIVDELGDRLRVPIVHGDTLTAATVIHQALAIIEKYGIRSPVFLTGATSKIGRAVAIYLAKNGIKVLMYTQDECRFKKIAEEAGEEAGNLKQVSSLGDGIVSSFWITGKAIPSGSELYRYMPEGAVVLNFAVPNPLKKKDFKRRQDIKSIEGGLLAYDPASTDLCFTMRLKRGVTYACHAGTIVHAMKGWSDHEVGPVDMGKLNEVWDAAVEAGFFLPSI